MNVTKKFQKTLLGSATAIAMLAVSSMALAGGLAVREQSAQFQGSSVAGNAAGAGLARLSGTLPQLAKSATVGTLRPVQR